METKHFYCGQLVRDYDPDRYLLSMLVAEPARRAALWALFAFNYEIAKTREIVTEMQLGRIRLQWWRDALEGFYARGEVLEHQVLAPLVEAIKAYDLPREGFETLIEAREFDLEDTRPENIEGFLNYCELTNAPLLRLAALIEGADPLMEPVSVIGTNYGLTGVLRSVPFMRQQGRNLLPLGEDNAAVLAENMVPDVKAVARILKGAQALSCIYFKQLRRAAFDLDAPILRADPPFKALRVLLRAML